MEDLFICNKKAEFLLKMEHPFVAAADPFRSLLMHFILPGTP